MLYDDLLQINLTSILNAEWMILFLVKLCEKKIIYNKRLIDVQYMCLCHKSHITIVNNHPWTHTDRDRELIYNVDLFQTEVAPGINKINATLIAVHLIRSQNSITVWNWTWVWFILINYLITLYSNLLLTI